MKNFPLSAFGRFRAHFEHNHIKHHFCKPRRVVKRDYILQMFWKIIDKHLSPFSNISSEEIDFEVWNCWKSSVILRSRIVHSPDQKKLVWKDWHTTITWSVPIGVMVKNKLWCSFVQVEKNRLCNDTKLEKLHCCLKFQNDCIYQYRSNGNKIPFSNNRIIVIHQNIYRYG